MARFSTRIQPSVDSELEQAQAAEERGDRDAAFRLLERAHVLGQMSTRQHVRVHWRMLRFALRNRMRGEAIGQALRIVASVIFTPFGLVPEGNTGGANVSAFARLPIPRDLQDAIGVARGPEPRAARMLGRLLAAAGVAAALAWLAGCSTPPANLDLSLEKASAAGTYRVALLPPAQAAAINQMHAWKVRLATRDGAPVHDARFVVTGGMPQHGHGLPTQPRVTRELEEGTYLLEGMKFSMTGWWDMRLAIQAGDVADTAVFNVVVDHSGIQREVR